MTEQELVDHIQKINSEIFFARDEKSLETEFTYYSYLPNLDKLKKTNSYGSCGNAALLLKTSLKEKFNIEADYVGVYFKPIKNFYSDNFVSDEFLSSILKNQEENFLKKHDIEENEIYENNRWTHALLEINVGNEKRIIDPTVGIYYGVSKEDLLRGNFNLIELLTNFNQFEYLKNSIHKNSLVYFYMSHMFWRNVYHLGYDNAYGDLPDQKDYENKNLNVVWSTYDPQKKSTTVENPYTYITKIGYGYGVPIYVDRNTEYIRNYDFIAFQHLKALSDSGSNPWQSIEFEKFYYTDFVNLLKTVLNPNDKLLDVGVAIGDLFNKILVKHKYGIDISIEYLNIARQRGIEVCLAMIEETPYKSEFFDVITCKDVLEHVLDINKVTAEIYRILKPNGYFLVQVPYKQNMKDYATKDVGFKFVHLRNFDEWTMKLLFEKIFNFKCKTFNIVNKKEDESDMTMINMLLQK